MPNRTQRVFISSTREDLSEHRDAVAKIIERLEHAPVRMESFGSRDGMSVAECRELVESADAIVVIVAHRYGWIPSATDGGDGRKSITWLEVEEAEALGKPVYAYLVDPKVRWTYGKESDRIDEEGADAAEIQRAVHSLKAFKADLSKRPLSTFTTPDNLAAQVAADLRRALLDSSGGDAALDAEIERYRKNAQSLHESIRLAGFESKVRVRIRVEDLYIPLRAVADHRANGAATFADADDAEKALGPGAEGGEVNLLDAFGRAAERGDRRGLVILGDPGSGKTTHLKHLLLKVLRDGSESVGLPGGLVPVLLPLRDLESVDRGLEAFIERVLSDPHLEIEAGFAGRLSRRGGLLLLLDGLDEVPGGDRRRAVANWIVDSLRTHRTDCRFVVTCRYAGYSDDARLDEDFLELHLRPLDEKQAEEFIRTWYRIVETGLSGDQEKAADTATQKAGELIELIRGGDFRVGRVRALTRNPLLLTAICLVHRDRGRLPHQRAQLYKEAVDVLLERWRAGERLPATFQKDEAEAVLQPMAHWLHQVEGRTRGTAGELAPVIAPALESVRRRDVEPKAFLEAIRDESGLLTGWSGESYGFMHLGFQEFLAAREIKNRALADPSVFSDLARRFGESWWREVGLLLVALEGGAAFEPYCRELVKQPAFGEKADLVAELMSDAARVSAKPFLELLDLPSGDDPCELWQRQLAAVRIVKSIAPEALDKIANRLREHKCREIADLAGAPAKAPSLVRVRKLIDAVRMREGTFKMGSPTEEVGRQSHEGPVHAVTLREFWLSVTPVTNEQYARFLAEEKGVEEPRSWSDGRFNQPRQPVVGVSWDEARQFCAWIGGELPTEAQWEYACRAGTQSRFWSGDDEIDLARVGWYEANSSGTPHPVGEKPANAFGLHDMHGNVWEWCADWYGPYGSQAQSDPKGPKSGSDRVLRGGSCWFDAGRCRSAYRVWNHPVNRNVSIGFRVAWPAAPSS